MLTRIHNVAMRAYILGASCVVEETEAMFSYHCFRRGVEKFGACPVYFYEPEILIMDAHRVRY